jgi:predicted N-acyltransferase
MSHDKVLFSKYWNKIYHVKSTFFTMVYNALKFGMVTNDTTLKPGAQPTEASGTA